MICSGPVERLVARVVVVGVAVAVAVAVAAVGLAGCGGGGDSDDEGPTATVPTTPPDPYAVPAVIDEAYVNRVLAALDQLSGDVLRTFLMTKTLPPDAIDRLEAAYVPDLARRQSDALQANLYALLAEHPTIPGNRHTEVSRLITARRSCIFAEVKRDYSEVVAAPDPRLEKQWVSLIPLDPSMDPHNYNRTSWVYSYDGYPEDSAPPEDPCANVF
jgi:hypothetical protein